MNFVGSSYSLNLTVKRGSGGGIQQWIEERLGIQSDGSDAYEIRVL